MVDVSQYSEGFRESLKYFYDNLGNFDSDVFRKMVQSTANLSFEEAQLLDKSESEIIKNWSRKNGLEFNNVYDYTAYAQWSEHSYLDPHSAKTYELYKNTKAHRILNESSNPRDRFFTTDMSNLIIDEAQPYASQFHEWSSNNHEYGNSKERAKKWKEMQSQDSKPLLPDSQEIIKPEPVVDESIPSSDTKQQPEIQNSTPEQEAADVVSEETKNTVNGNNTKVVSEEIADTTLSNPQPEITETAKEVADEAAESIKKEAKDKVANAASDSTTNAGKNLIPKTLGTKGKIALGIAAGVFLYTATAESRRQSHINKKKPQEADRKKQKGELSRQLAMTYSQNESAMELAADISTYRYGK